MASYGPRSVDSMILNLPTLESKSPTGWYGFERKLAFWNRRQYSQYHSKSMVAGRR